MNNRIKIIFFGTHEFSASILSSLLNNFKKNIEVKLIVSQPDKIVWRKKILEKTPVKILAQKNNINYQQPNILKKNLSFFNILHSIKPDFIVVVAYWKIVPKEVLEVPKYFCINIHWSILPKYRWASPIQEAIKNWDKKTGITIMCMSEGMDEWNILKTKEVEIWKHHNTKNIFKKFENIWPQLLANTLQWILNWTIRWIKQDKQKASYCSKIKKEDWEINFQKESGIKIYNKFRAYHSWPWIFSYYDWKKINFEEVELKEYIWYKNIWEIEKIQKNKLWIICKNKKLLLLKQVKLEWKKSMDILSFINWNKKFLDYKF